ncbi:MAG: winged helix DNA-binding domain-containing protein, partial [Geodermatophilaceae bacterium]|nr:winged helix DNA-binding domain-containing protein [Geodermatophilaceae bacterium]
MTVYLSAMVRMRSPTVQAVERALYEEGTLLRQHAMRRTLWVATPQTIRRMHAAATRKLAVTEHKRTVQLLQDNGIDDGDAWLCPAKREVLAVLHEQGPMTARQLGRLVPVLAHPLQLSPGKSYAATQAAHTRVLFGLGFDGALVVPARPDRGSTGSTRGPRRTPCFPAASIASTSGMRPGMWPPMAASVRPGHDHRSALVDGL